MALLDCGGSGCVISIPIEDFVFGREEHVGSCVQSRGWNLSVGDLWW